jgi:hypothetical protein
VVYEGSSPVDPLGAVDWLGTASLPTELPRRNGALAPLEAPVPAPCEVHPDEAGAVTAGEDFAEAAGCVGAAGDSPVVELPVDSSPAASAPVGSPATRAIAAAIVESARQRRRNSFLFICGLVPS